MSDTSVTIYLDESVKNNSFFKKPLSIKINKGELFKYAIMMWEVPSHVTESDFDYLQSKVPGLELLLSEAVTTTADAIINKSSDDRVQKLASEAIGVGVGLKYSTELLKTNPNKFKKIGVAASGKYLDYSTNVDTKLFEIETKGTVNKSYATMKRDIVNKKADQDKSVYLRYGTITMIQKSGSISASNCVVVDDPPENKPPVEEDVFQTQMLNYAILFSFIMDPKYYNKYIKPVLSGRRKKVRIATNKFFAKYVFEGKTYLGECFDYRLIRSEVDRVLAESSPNSVSPFTLITKKLGRTKFFVGLEDTVVQAINKKDSDLLAVYNSGERFVEELSSYSCLNRDGILIVKSAYGNDRQLEQVFSEEEVERRLGLYSNYIIGVAHKCNAPCRSREIEGKPCDKMTYQRHCHFHR